MANIKEAISSVKNISDSFDLSKRLATTQSFVDVTQEPFPWTFSFEKVFTFPFVFLSLHDVCNSHISCNESFHVE